MGRDPKWKNWDWFLTSWWRFCSYSHPKQDTGSLSSNSGADNGVARMKEEGCKTTVGFNWKVWVFTIIQMSGFRNAILIWGKKKKVANVSLIFPYLDIPNIDSQEDGERHHLNMDCPGLRGESQFRQDGDPWACILQAITAPSQVLLLCKAKQYNCRTPTTISQTVILHLISGGGTLTKL